MQESSQPAHIFSYWSGPFGLVLTEHRGCVYISYATHWIHRCQNTRWQPPLQTCRSQGHWVSNSSTAGARNALAQAIPWPHHGWQIPSSSRKAVEKQRERIVLVGRLKVRIFAEKPCTQLPSSYLKPTIGHSLQMLHLAWCFAVSEAATRCRTGSHTIDCGSKRIQSINCFTVISGLLWFCREEKKTPHPNKKKTKPTHTHTSRLSLRIQLKTPTTCVNPFHARLMYNQLQDTRNNLD